MMKKGQPILLLLAVIISTSFLLRGSFALAQSEKAEIDFFYSALCPHCTEEKEFLEGLKKKYPEVLINQYEVIYNKENTQILKDFYEKYEVPNGERGRVPITFTPTRYFIGFNETIGENIEECLKECISGEGETSQKIHIPLLGTADLSKMSLPVLAITLGLLDGFNPCAMWILLFLITLLLNTRSRKRMLLVGGTFVLASGIIYFLILSSWLNLFLAIGYVNLTRILIGAFALGVGAWQIKNFVTYNPGVCKVLGIKSKIEQNLRERAQGIVSSPVTLAMIGSLIVLALGVNLVEFFCSAGLPTIFTRILALNKLGVLNHNFYLFLYTFVFMLDDTILLVVAAIAFSKIGFTEKYNYWSTLIGALLILALGALLIFKPELLMFA